MSLHFTPNYLKNELYQCFIEVVITDQLSFLTPEHLKKLIDCIRSPTNGLFEGMCSFGNEYALCLYDKNSTPKAKKADSVHYPTIEFNASLERFANVQNDAQFFTNGSPFEDEPFTNKGYYYHSFKCKKPDSLDREQFLNEQIEWTINRIDEKHSSVVDTVFEHLYGYGDFGGLFCTWDGNDTIEIHTEWDIRHLALEKFSGIKSKYHQDVQDRLLCNGLKRYWDVLSEQIAQIIQGQTCMPVKFESSLRDPESYRRLSWGKRLVKNCGEFLDIDYLIPQVELYANTCRSRYIFKTSKPNLHSPSLFFAA